MSAAQGISEYFGEIPAWPDFAILNDEASGRVPVTKVANWRAFSDILEQDFFNRRGTRLIYRGQRRYDWPLAPSLGRLDERRIVTAENAERQIALFRRAVRGRLDDRGLVEAAEENELWAVGQHYGLLTPLLDWTYSPFVALFFAFEREDREREEPNLYRAVYALNKSHVEAEDRCPGVDILEPRKDDYGRLVNQAGLFTYSAFGDTLENSLVNSLKEEVLGDIEGGREADALSRYICKIYIPNEGRSECLRQLRRMNVHHASLFPDLIGASLYCNSLVAEEAGAERFAEATAPAERIAEAPVTEAEPPLAFAPGNSAGSIIHALSAPISPDEVSPVRIESMAREVADEIAKRQYVDWQKRESVQAEMRTSARSVLRRLGYPAFAREAALDEIIKNLIEGAPP